MQLGTIKLPVAGLKYIRSQLRRPQGPLQKALRSWSTAYSAFIVNRFNTFSRGGGNWRPLAEGTIRSKRSSAILVDRGQLKTGLRTIVGINRIETMSSTRVVMTFVKGKRHRSGLDLAKLATIHHMGLGAVPKRPILATPDAATKTRMSAAIATAVRKIINGSFQ